MASKQQKSWHYVLVMTSEGPKFVTSLEHGSKTAHWDMMEKPLELSKEWAKDLVIGLMWNGYNAFHVDSPIELDNQPYRYSMGHFEWVNKEEKEA